MKQLLGASAATLAAVILGGSFVAEASTQLSFYEGKALTVYVASGVGGPYDLRARLLAPYLKKYLNDSVTVIVSALPGAGGLRAANSLCNTAPRDGTAIGILQPTLAFNQAIRLPGVQYDAARFKYLGSLEPLDTMVATGSNVNVRNLEDAQRNALALGSTGNASPSSIVPQLMNRYLGTKFRIVTGYAGVGDILLAVERGEVGGLAIDWRAIASARRQWRPGIDVFAIAKSGLNRSPELPNVPTMMEIAPTEAVREIFRFYAVSNSLGVAVVSPPATPDDRVNDLRQAVSNALADSEFLAAAATAGINIEPITGNEAEAIVLQTLAAPPEVISEIKKIVDAP